MILVPLSFCIQTSNSDLADSELWDSNFNIISIFSIIKKSMDDVKNVINCIVLFIDKRDLKNYRETNFPHLEGFGQVAWNPLLAIYKCS